MWEEKEQSVSDHSYRIKPTLAIADLENGRELWIKEWGNILEDGQGKKMDSFLKNERNTGLPAPGFYFFLI